PHARDGAGAVSRPAGLLGKAGVTPAPARTGRRPIHTAYVGALLFRAGLAGEWGELALRALADQAPHPAALAAALDCHVDDHLFARLQEKLRREPIEDLRIDFEDGFGARSDEAEDGAARSAASEVRSEERRVGK